MKTQADCKKEWEKLKSEILEKIEKIDGKTPWTEFEPSWWLDMMDIKVMLLRKIR